MTAPGLRLRFVAELWEHDGPAAWFFLSLPEDEADAIEDAVGRRRGFGSVRVEATIGATTWRTSVFPDSRRRTFVLPVKRAVRDAEQLDAGSRPTVELAVLDPAAGL